ncbi:MAG: metal-dependent hydrolase [archaeon]
MMLKTHLAFAFLLSLVFLHFFTSNPYYFIPLACLGAFVVDVDTPHSGFGKRVRPLSWFVEFFLGHRGILHSLFAAFLLLLLSVYLFTVSYIAFAPVLGYLSHIFLDAFTPSGVAFFQPFSERRLQGPITTGGIIEYVLFSLVVITDAYLIYIAI